MNFEYRDYYFREGDEAVIIAEVGVNHNGDPEIAKRMVDAAVDAGVHIVKFQAFRSEKEISKFAPKAPYQKETTGEEENQLEMCKALELSGSILKEMKEYCTAKGVSFLCTAFESDSVDLLVDVLKVKTIKIPSGEVTNIPLLRYIGSKKVGAILSTGASTLEEVRLAVEAINVSGCPELVLLHCVSNYPVPHHQVNLRAMKTLRDAFGLPVGFSDHTTGTGVAIAAAALGAVAIEKHFTLDSTMEGPDHRASIEPGELRGMVAGIREAGLSLGCPVKAPAPCELPNLPLIRKSLVAARDLKRGETLTREMIEIKRPTGGIEPAGLDKVIGAILKRGLSEDEPIKWEDLV